MTRTAMQDTPLLRVYASVASYRWLSGYYSSHVGAFGGVAWWKDQRQMHAALFTMYAVSNDWRFLAADTAFGALNWIRAERTTRRKSLST